MIGLNRVLNSPFRCNILHSRVQSGYCCHGQTLLIPVHDDDTLLIVCAASAVRASKSTFYHSFGTYLMRERHELLHFRFRRNDQGLRHHRMVIPKRVVQHRHRFSVANTGQDRLVLAIRTPTTKEQGAK